ncbi:hypothetical protein [Kineococcus glutinatus]|uniref:Helix-turn-helix domain-containing protein n=1 Tax=Kineococcus glutinatus TaxID=1070872 RepID=A0ABP9HIP4_9ACTN
MDTHTPETEASEPFIGSAAVAALIGKTPRWVVINQQRLALPRYRLGAHWRYRRPEVLAWLDAQAVR